MLMFPPFCVSALLSKLAPLPLLFNSTTVETGPARLHQCHQTQPEARTAAASSQRVVGCSALGIPAEGFYSQDCEADAQPADPGIPPPARHSLISAANVSEREECVFVYGASVSPHCPPPPAPPPPTTPNRGLFMAACRGRASEPDGRALELSQELQSAGTDWKHSQGPQCRLPGLNAVGWHGIGWQRLRWDSIGWGGMGWAQESRMGEAGIGCG